MYKSYSMELAGRTLTVDIGRVAKQANGAALMHYGDTTVLATATASKEPREGIDFFPLSVEYEEKMYAVGKIPGGFNKREGKASEHAILTSRVIDRPMRPLFPKDYRNDVTLVDGVRFGAAVEQADILGVREQLLNHSSLLVQRRKVRGAGNVVADRAGPATDIQRRGVVRDRGAQHRDVCGSLCSSLQRCGGIGQNQIHIIGNKAVHDGGAVGRVAGGVLLVKLDVALAQLLGQGVFEALRSGVQCLVLDKLADADVVDLSIRSGGAVGGGFAAGSGGVSGGCCGIRGSGRAAGGQAHRQGGGHHERDCFFHCIFLQCTRCVPFVSGVHPHSLTWVPPRSRFSALKYSTL